MKITHVNAHVLEAPIREPFRWSFNSTASRGSCIVEIVTDSGLTGWGECFGPSELNAAVVRAFAQYLVGQDPLKTEGLWQLLYETFRDQGQKGLIVTALSGVDIALWDIKGKHFNAPIGQLMGGPLRDDVEAYATGTYRLKHGDPHDYIIKEVEGYRREGFKGVKLKIGFDVEADASLIRAVRKAIGPGCKLMLDANHGFDTIEAIRLGNLVADQDITWFEEPVIPEDLDAYCAVRAKQPIPVAGGECEFTRYGFRSILQKGAIDILQPDTCAAGGLSECKKIADMALAFGVRYVPHVWGTAIGLAAALQLIAVLPPMPLRHTPREPLLEFDRSEHPFRQAVVTRPIEHENGRVRIPTGPGLGIEVDREALKRFAKAAH
jgi:D-galactarolactone cycloisomerase